MQQGKSHFIQGLGTGVATFVAIIACANGDDPGGITLPQAGTEGGGRGGSSAGQGGSVPHAGAPDASGGEEIPAGSGGTTAGNGGSGSGTGGRQGHAGEGEGATGADGSPGAGGQAGDDTGGGGVPALGGTGGTAGGQSAGTAGISAGSGGNPPTSSDCIYHSAPQLSEAGAGGAGSAPLSGVKVAAHTFLGPYLTDAAGYALYIYGADVPGDCNTPPVSNCYADCPLSWPIFNANARELDPSLNDAVFGTIQRTDGTFQTTYYGWPLYTYKSDTAPNVINGQNRAKIWFAAETYLPNLMIMRTPVAAGGIKYLSDDRGYTLYAHSADTVGSGSTPPVSACSGACLDAYRPYAPDEIIPVTFLEPRDVRFFTRDDGSYQASFQGAPLYYSRADVLAGQQNGLVTDVWELVIQ